MRTLHVDLGPDWRGGQSQALLLLRGLVARGHGADLLALEGSPLARRARATGIAVHPVQRRMARIHTAFRIHGLLQGGKIDVVHAHDAHALTAAWLARAHRQSVVVASRRVCYPLKPGRIARSRYQAAACVIAISRFVAESARSSGLPAEKLKIAYSGVELPELPSLEARTRMRQRWGVGSEPLLGCVGYLLPDKGQASLIRALPALRTAYPDCRLLLAGDGPCRPALARTAEELEVASAVTFAGFIEDLAQVYPALDLFLFPAEAEGLGTSLLTAMAYGLPVVAVGGGAAPEVITAGENGMLLSDRKPGTIAAAVGRVLEDAGFAAHLGQAARASIEERFSADQMVESTLAIYEQFASAKGT